MGQKLTLQDRYRGALVGLAVGDALGAAVEFEPPGSFEPLTDMVPSPVHEIPAGYWTDDGTMALCLAESLIKCNGLNANDNLDRYCLWHGYGYYSSNGTCFDIGIQTHTALQYFEQFGKHLPPHLCADNAGNGSLMRLAPVPMAYYSHPEMLVEMCAASSRTTHTSPLCTDACRFFGLLLWGAFSGFDKEDLLRPDFWARHTGNGMLLHSNIEHVALGSYKSKDTHIRGTSYVVDSLEAALWAFYSTDNFKDAVLAAANLGDDADTTAAITGQIAGAFYGFGGIPSQWVHTLYFREADNPDPSGKIFETFADQLLLLQATLTV